MARKKSTLHIYWDDGVTIENRDFPSKDAAKSYAKGNGIVNYMIDSEDDEELVFLY
jgi:hypothetical protein